MRDRWDLLLMIIDDLEVYVPIWIFIGMLYLFNTTPLRLGIGATFFMVIFNVIKWRWKK